MREIKFRAWNKVNNKMIYYDEDCSAPDMTLNGVLISHDKQSNVSYQYELMQFTGLLDKNGKEIYFDSSIVEYTYEINNDVERSEETRTGVVILDLKYTNSLCVKTAGGGLYHFTASEMRNIEVVGTVHENPELMRSE